MIVRWLASLVSRRGLVGLRPRRRVPFPSGLAFIPSPTPHLRAGYRMASLHGSPPLPAWEPAWMLHLSSFAPGVEYRVSKGPKRLGLSVDCYLISVPSGLRL